MTNVAKKSDRSVRSLLTLAAAFTLLTAAARASAPSSDSPPPETVREIFVPNTDLKVLLESEPHRVLLSRAEYDALVKKAKKSPETHAPCPTVTVSSDYDITIDEGRARLHGAIAIDVLEDGLQAVPLDFGGVGLLAAKLDDQPAAIGYDAQQRLNLLVSGKGTHKLALELVAPLEMNSAQQYLSFRLTNAAVGRWRLTVPGDVEIKSGADVVSRVMDEAAKVTRFELLPRSGDSTILMSLNSHFQRLEQAVAARCVVFDEVTEAYEKLHATVTCWILHRATDRFRFVVPQGFEITEINSPLLARWDIVTEAGRKIVNVRLREQTTDTVVLSVAAIKTPAVLKQWRMPRLELLDVVGQVTVLGLLVQGDIKAESLTAKDLIPVDTRVLATALPATLVRPDPGAVPLRYIAAYYAPQSGYDLTADFSRAPRTLSVTTNLLLSIQNKGCEVRGGFALLPAAEKRFSFDFSVPAGWSVIEVTGPDNRPLAIERFAGEKPGSAGRVHVKLPQGIAPGQFYVANFRAEYTPPGWLSDWKSQSLEFPMFRVAGAQRDEGAVAVTADEDMVVRPDKVEGLVPITEAEMARFGMREGAMNVAYRYEGAAAKTTIAVDRTQSRATARTFAFFQVVPDLLRAHYVVIYTIEDAKTRRLALVLPASTPEALRIRGLDGVNVKEFISEPVPDAADKAGEMRRWNVYLDEARRGEVRLEVDFEMRPQAAVEPTPDASGKITELKDFELPLVKADGVVYQSGLVAVEGDLELAVDVKTDARRADVGQLAISKYTPASLDPAQLRPGNKSPMRLLGTYEFVGQTPKVAIDVVRNPSYPITPAIVEKAKLTTLLSADGTSQTQAAFQLRTKASYLEFELPEKATLWSAVLDGTPVKPQKSGDVRLIGLPATASDAARNLQIVYEAPVESLKDAHRLSLKAPRLLYRASRTAKKSTEIPLVNIEWNVTAPDGYEVIGTDGTLEAKAVPRPMPAPLVVAGVLYELGGGVFESHVSYLSGYGAKSPSILYESGKEYTTQDNMISNLSGGKGGVEGKGYFEYIDGSKSMAAPEKDMKEGLNAVTRGPMVGKPWADKWGSLLEKEEGAEKDAREKGDILLFGDKSRKNAESKSDAGISATYAETLARNPGLPSGGLGMQFKPSAAGEAPPPPATAASPTPSVNVGPNAAGTTAETANPSVPALIAPTRRRTTAQPAQAGAALLGSWGVDTDVNGGSAYTVVKPTYQRGDLLGFRSLKIDVEQSGTDGQLVTFNSLGASPQIGITLARRNRNSALVWGIALAVFVLGIALTGQPVRRKTALVIAILLISALLPLAWDTVSFARICNGVFYAACLLVPYYLAAGLCSWTLKWLRGVVSRITAPPPAATALVLGIAMLLATTAQAQPLGNQAFDLSSLAAKAAAEQPVSVPGDALIVPYDAKSKTGIQDADHLLVSYDRYVELWNRAYPDKKIEAHPAPLAYALSDASYSAVLGRAVGVPALAGSFSQSPAEAGTPTSEGEESLNITGQMTVTVLAEGYVSVPLGLRGGVLARANLDGKPAQLKVVSVGDRAAFSKARRQPAAMDATLLVLQVSGKGPHKLELEVRMKLAHVGGWRGTSGSLPAAPAATVTFRVPQAQTEVRLGQTIDHRIHETQKADETLETALGPGGALQLQWRPKVAEAQVDRGLTVQTAAVLDIQEDGLRMGLHINLEFRRGQRDAFTLSLPAEYLVEKVAGINVRGWEVRRAGPNQAAGQNADQTVEVSLLKTAKDTEQFNLFLSRGGKVGQVPLDTFAVPQVTVRDASLSSGLLTIRRSGLLDVRTLDRAGITRIDVGPLPDLSGGPATDESVLAIRPYEAYRFPTTPFTLRLSASPTVADVTTEAQTRVTLDPNQPSLESRIIVHVGQRRVYRLEMSVPDDLRLPEVTLPSAGIWSIEKRGGRSVLEVYLQQGVLGDVALILRGKLAPLDAQQAIGLPQLEVLGVKRQEGTIALQADPAFTVEAHDLQNCQETQLERVSAWLDPNLRGSTRLALHYDSGMSSGPYSGKLRLLPRTPEVVCDTVTNVHVTDRAIEETIILNYAIRNAGVRELNFLLPASMADARISTPMLRRKTISPVDPKAPENPVHVKLELQGDAMNDLRVLIQNDRLLKSGSDSHTAPLPSFEPAAGHAAEIVRHQYVVLEKPSNRDELVVEPLHGFVALSRQQQQWQALSEMLGGKQMYVYLMEPGAAAPQVSFHMQRHEDVETAGARIDLAETTIVVDVNGSYRAKLQLSLDNTSEQFLDVELPDGAALWAVSVAGEPVKPAAVPGAKDLRHVLLPVRKTAKGDPNYLVVLKYGGKMPPLSVASAVEFPLVRTVTSYPRNDAIGIEQTQVEVYLPKSHYWYNFSRTMHSTEDEAELKAGRITAFTKEGQRFIEAAQDADPFTQVRGKENLKNWVAAAENKMQEENGRGGRTSGNKVLELAIASCASTATRAKDALQEAADGKRAVAGQDDMTNLDNRGRLNELYDKQNVVNAQGGLAMAGANSYSGGTTINGGALVTQGNGEFNWNWIERNNLGNDAEVAQRALARGQGTGTSELVTDKLNQHVNDAVPGYELSLQNGLTKLGAGTLVLAGSNSFSGETTISAGTLQIGNGGTMYGGVISNSSGTFNVGGANTYGGPTVTDNGALQHANPNFANGPIILNNDQQAGGQGNAGNSGLSANGSLTFGALSQAKPQMGSFAWNSSTNAANQSNAPAQPQQAYGGRGGRGGNRDDQQRELSEYQQKLAGANPVILNYKSVQEIAKLPVGTGYTDLVNGAASPQATPAPTAPAAPASQPGASGEQTGQQIAFGPSQSTAAATAPAGLASLDFELPTDTNLYELHRFTTPRGKAELSARSISNKALGKLEFLLGLAVASVALWFAFRVIGSGVLRWFFRPLGAALLLVLGIAALCGGVLPFLGVLAILAAIGLLIAAAVRATLARQPG